MLRKVNEHETKTLKGIPVSEASFPVPFGSGLEYAAPARGTWNIVHTGMLIPEGHEIFVCAASCLRGVVLTAAEMNAQERFSTIEIKEDNLLEGNMEELIIEGVTHIIGELPKKPRAILLYTSCVHHFAGTDLDHIYRELRERFPEIDFTDCYMNPIMRKSGMTPDQLMRSRLYALLKQRPKRKEAVAIIGNDLPTRKESELIRFLEKQGCKVHEITSCKTYEEYQEMAESSYYISYQPAAVAGGDALSKRLGGVHLYLPFSFSFEEIDDCFENLSKVLGTEVPDFTEQKKACEKALKETKALLGDTPVSIDYTFCHRPLGLARLLLDAGISVKKVYLDAISPEEKEAFLYLQKKEPQLLLYPTVHAGMRFMANKTRTQALAIGQKAAYFENTNHFVNVVEGGGMFGYDAILHTLHLMREAYLEEKDMRRLIQVKGMGCGGCV